MKRRKRPAGATQPGVQMALTTTPNSVLIPSSSGMGYAKTIRVSSVSAACVRVGQAGDVATANDCLVQAGDAVKLNAMGCTHVSARALTGATTLAITPLDEGDWVPVPVVDVDLRGGVLPANWAFSRASVATRVNASGLVETVAANLPRADWDPVTGALRGLLIELQSVNLLTWSDDATQWANQINVTRARNQAAPDGSTNGTLVNVIASSGARVETGNIAITNATVYTVSVWMKAGAANGAVSLGDGGGTVYAYAKATLSGAGAVTIAGSGATGSIERHAGGWYRVALSVTSTTSSVRVALHPWDGIADQFAYPAGSVGASCTFWGMQLEQSSWVSSYMPTTAATASRASDMLAAVPFVRSGVMTALTEVHSSGGSTLYPALLSFGARGGPASDQLTPYVGPANMITAEAKLSGVSSSVTPSQPVPPSLVRLAMRLTGTSLASCVNGGAISSAVMAGVPATTHLSVSNDNARQAMDGFVWSGPPLRLRRLVVYAAALNDAHLQAITA